MAKKNNNNLFSAEAKLYNLPGVFLPICGGIAGNKL